MINYSDKKNLLKMIDLEAISLKSTLDIQKNLNKQILTFMKNFVGNVDVEVDFSPNNETFSYINKSSNSLIKSNSNINNLQLLLKNLEKLKSLINETPSNTEIEPTIEKYNKKFISSIETIYKNTSVIQKFLFEISTMNLKPYVKSSNEKETSSKAKRTKKSNDNIKDFTITDEELRLSYLENTLVISDIQKKVILPYKIEIIKEILLNDNSYTSLEDVINKLYTIPIDVYKLSSLARFREAYKLIIEKEHGSKMQALSLATELFFNYNLHPAIITACENLDQLDIYLACLEDGDLDKFNFFNIKYEIAPAISTSDNL